ncbi:type IV conjugative transfer system coupling protein TraD, partial [Cronobacter sakazakii]
FYVRLPGEYPVVRLGLKYRAQKKRNAGLMERNIRDALSPELEKVIRENERTAAAAGLNFPTGDEVLEGQPVTPAPEPEIVPDAAKPAAPAVQPRPEKKAAAQPTDKPAAPEQATAEPALASQVSDSVPVAQQPAARTVPAPQEGKTAEPARPTIPQRSDNVVSLRPAATPTAPAADAVKPAVFSRPQPAASRSGVTGSALEMLQRRVRQSDNQNSEEEAPQEGGETMNLDMAVTQLPDGGLQLTTAGNTPDEHSVPANGRAGHRMAQEEENILRHREQGEPGPWVAYDHDFEHDDGEYER